MALDPTLKESNIWSSVKKFFIDNITSAPVYFDRIITSSESSNQWINVLLEELSPAHVSVASMPVYIFSKEDKEGDKLAKLRDNILELLTQDAIDLYDDEWNKVGGLFIVIEGQSRRFYTENNSKMQYINTTLKWASIWNK